MNIKSLVFSACKIGKHLLFVFVFYPAVFFGCLFLGSLLIKGSPTPGEIYYASTESVRYAENGKVWGCKNDERIDFTRPTKLQPILCEKQLIDESVAIKSFDRELMVLYALVVMFSVFLHFCIVKLKSNELLRPNTIKNVLTSFLYKNGEIK
jgi:hypothetical protein